MCPADRSLIAKSQNFDNASLSCKWCASIGLMLARHWWTLVSYTLQIIVNIWNGAGWCVKWIDSTYHGPWVSAPLLTEQTGWSMKLISWFVNGHKHFMTERKTIPTNGTLQQIINVIFLQIGCRPPGVCLLYHDSHIKEKQNYNLKIQYISLRDQWWNIKMRDYWQWCKLSKLHDKIKYFLELFPHHPQTSSSVACSWNCL